MYPETREAAFRAALRMYPETREAAFRAASRMYQRSPSGRAARSSACTLPISDPEPEGNKVRTRSHQVNLNLEQGLWWTPG